MRADDAGFYYFIDRVGDTFRWKGENVAASEVAEALTAFPAIVEARVYGVLIPGTEGAAGMAAIVVEGDLDLVALHLNLARRLPNYAVPLFIRNTERIEATTTFKYTTSDLKREGYNPTATSDAIFFNHPDERKFIRVNQALYKQIQSGKLRV
jgi:fatty-acyl-CoA synthase